MGVCVSQRVRSSPSTTAVPSFISQDNLGQQLLPRLLLPTWVRERETMDNDRQKKMDGWDMPWTRKVRGRERVLNELFWLTSVGQISAPPPHTVVNVYSYISCTTLSPTREYSYFSKSHKDCHKEPVFLILNDSVQALGRQSCRMERWEGVQPPVMLLTEARWRHSWKIGFIYLSPCLYLLLTHVLTIFASYLCVFIYTHIRIWKLDKWKPLQLAWPVPLLIGWQQQFITHSPTQLYIKQVKGNWWHPQSQFLPWLASPRDWNRQRRIGLPPHHGCANCRRLSFAEALSQRLTRAVAPSFLPSPFCGFVWQTDRLLRRLFWSAALTY